MLFRLQDVWKGYGGTEILKGVSFQVNPNEKVGLVGRNGAGKTTVFRIITGQEAPDDGELIKMNGLKLGLLDQHVDFGEVETVHTAALSAFKEIHDMEAEMRHLEKTMETDHSDAVLNRYADLQTEFEHADGFSYAAKAESVLLGMGFAADSWGEDVRTLSLFGGKTISGGKSLQYSITPLVGFSAGNFTGVSLAANAEIDWMNFYISSQTQYSIATKQNIADFLFSWSELGYNISSKFFGGLAIQYTRQVGINNVEPGFVAGINLKKISIPCYVFNPSNPDRYFVVGLNFEFDYKNGK